jgi:hypothetical protein
MLHIEGTYNEVWYFTHDVRPCYDFKNGWQIILFFLRGGGGEHAGIHACNPSMGVHLLSNLNNSAHCLLFLIPLASINWNSSVWRKRCFINSILWYIISITNMLHCEFNTQCTIKAPNSKGGGNLHIGPTGRMATSSINTTSYQETSHIQLKTMRVISHFLEWTQKRPHSLRSNPLAPSPGQVKLDSDKWRLWNNLFE